MSFNFLNSQILIEYITLALLAFDLLFSQVHCSIIEVTFNISYTWGSPDGVTKQILTANGQFPGPSIVATVGDTMIVNVINNIQDGQNTSIHWHGIRQRGSPWQDGTSMIAQCPLKAGQMQVYKFVVDEPGTYWWHAHAKSQYTEGLWGALIVLRQKGQETYDYDGEILITLTDWYHRLSRPLEAWHLSNRSFGAPPYPDSGLMNGVGRTNCSIGIQRPDWQCRSESQHRPLFHVKPGATYRIRVINAAGYSVFRFSIDGHKLRVIEVDGSDVEESEPLVGVLIAAAQRYSFLVKMDATVAPTGRFLVRADMATDILLLGGSNINGHHAQLMANVTGVLEYQNSTFTPSFNIESVEPFDFHQPIPTVPKLNSTMWLTNDSFLQPRSDQSPSPPYFDQEFTLNLKFRNDAAGVRRGSINNISFQLPTDKPIIAKARRNESMPFSNPLFLGYNNTIQIVINNPFIGPHPIHLHGHSFWVLGQGKPGDGVYDPLKHADSLRLNTITRDTVFVYQGSWAVIKFIADNPGVWALHCHIDWHNLSGMAAVLVEAPQELSTQFPPPDHSLQLCAAHNITL